MPKALPLEEELVATLRRIARAIGLHSRLLLQKNGLTIPQLAALQAIERLQPIAVGVLAREIHLGAATVTGILGRLEKRGLVSRTRGSLDRRSVVIQLTDEGTQLVKEAPSLLQDRFRRELAKLPQWEQTMILATLQRVASMMDTEGIEAGAELAAGVEAEGSKMAVLFGKAVAAAEQADLAEEELGGLQHEFQHEPYDESDG